MLRSNFCQDPGWLALVFMLSFVQEEWTGKKNVPGQQPGLLGHVTCEVIHEGTMLRRAQCLVWMLLNFCCYHLEILNTFWAGIPKCSSCTGPHKLCSRSCFEVINCFIVRRFQILKKKRTRWGGVSSERKRAEEVTINRTCVYLCYCFNSGLLYWVDFCFM